jgi:ribosomal protein S18 acetylase RimI-like enzyme
MLLDWNEKRGCMKIELRLMSVEEFPEYKIQHMKAYARNRVLIDYETLEEAEVQTQLGFLRLLPYGIETPDHYFFHIFDLEENEKVGAAWLKVDRSESLAWLYDIGIDPPYRRQGYARAAMKLLFTRARELGARVFWLNVLENNQAAQSLYRSLQMRTAALHMNLLLE